MGRITGIGGVFFRARDPEKLGAWYREQLGMPFENGFAQLPWSGDADLDAATMWSPFEHETTYFGPGTQTTMTNFRVDDLDALLDKRKAGGFEIVPDRMDGEFGRFAWIVDPEGNRVELWEPKRRT